MDIKEIKQTKKILIVDDEEAISNVVKNFLKKEGYDVISFNDPKRALGFLKSSFKVDLIITDLKMPEVSGIFIIQEGEKKNIPSLIISSGIGAQVEETIEDFGYNVKDIFYKPFDLYKLSAAVAKKLGIEEKK